MAKSIIQAEKECYICRRWYAVKTTRGLEEHHILIFHFSGGKGGAALRCAASPSGTASRSGCATSTTMSRA